MTAPDFAHLVRRIGDELATAGIDSPRRDARLLVAHAAGLSPAGLILREKDPVGAETLGRAETFAARRARGEPVARIIGEKEFYGLVFALGPATLVPRPETELLVEIALTHLAGKTAPRFVDLGTGTGCIAIALAMHAPAASGLATDRSDDALAVARANAATYDLGARLAFAQGDWFHAVSAGERFDCILSNPPYISSREIPTLDREVREYDPFAALDGGPDGLDAFREIIARAPSHLASCGLLAVEIGAAQSESVAGLFEQAGLESVTTRRDLEGHDRVVAGRLPARKS